MMKTVLCTLYNSLYLDKGIVLYESLKACSKNFELYVLCMDDKCFNVLSDFGEENLKPIHLVDVENDKMLEAKGNRSIAEYCWTCSSRLVQYIFEIFQPDCCAYIDADMYFYRDPQLLVDEMINSGKSVMMVPHWFTDRNMHLVQRIGAYCVEFNCFKNDIAGNKVLNHWHNRCLECCSILGDGIHWGDQKYMDEWPVLFKDDVHVCENVGAGIAPWNIESYCDYDVSDCSLYHKISDKRIPVVFYHFQTVSYITRKRIKSGVELNSLIDYKTVDSLYVPYLSKLDKAKELLIKQYDINLLVTNHPSDNIAKWKMWINKSGLLRTIKNYLKKSDRYYIINLKRYVR